MTSVLLDARMAVRGLGIATFVDRLVDGFREHPSVAVSLWRGGGGWDGRGKVATLARSGLFDVSPRLDPRVRGFDAVHFLSNFGSLRPGSNSVLTVHDLLYRRQHRRRDRLLGFLLEQSLPRAGRVVAVSGRTRSELEHAFPHLADKVHVIPHGMRRVPPPDKERTYVLTFGGASDPRKRTDFMVAAYREYQETTDDPLPLTVLARAGLTDRQAHELHGLGARLVSDATGPEVDALFAGAAAVLFPTAVEGFGLPILEAAEVGTPVVMDADADVAAEVVGPHCYRVARLDLRDWADAVRKAVAGGPVFNALALPDWSAVAGQYAELYRAVSG